MKYYAVVRYEWWIWYRIEDRLDDVTKELVAVYLDSVLAEKRVQVEKALGARHRPLGWPEGTGTMGDEVTVQFDVYIQEGEISHE